MFKENYKAWQVKSDEYSDKLTNVEKLRFFTNYAILSPSGHNTQPWLFEFKNDTLFLRLNPHHHLSGDEEGLLSVEPFISLGACLETLRLAAVGFGINLTIKYILDDDLIASVEISGKSTPDKKLINAITSRVSNRNAFKTTVPDKATLQNITKSDYKNASLYPVTDKSDINFISEETHKAIQAIIANPKYRMELSNWVRTNFTKKYDGMPGFTHGIPNGPSLLAKPATRLLRKADKQAAKNSMLVKNSGAVALILAHERSEDAFLNAGRLYARACIVAQQNNLASSGVGASLIDPASRAEVVKRLGLKHEPLALIRFGIPTKPGLHSPRWPIDEVTVN